MDIVECLAGEGSDVVSRISSGQNTSRSDHVTAHVVLLVGGGGDDETRLAVARFPFSGAGSGGRPGEPLPAQGVQEHVVLLHPLLQERLVGLVSMSKIFFSSSLTPMLERLSLASLFVQALGVYPIGTYLKGAPLG
jgi:hypothetical protein